MVILVKELVLKMIQLYGNWLFTYKLNIYVKISCSQVVKTNEGVWKMGRVKIWQAASYLAALPATHRAGIRPFIELGSKAASESTLKSRILAGYQILTLLSLLFKSLHRLLKGPNRSARPTPQRIPSTP